MCHICDKLLSPPPPPPTHTRLPEVALELIGKDKMELYVFDVQKQPISIHQPLARVLAGLLTGADAHSVSLTDLLQISATVSISIV